MSEVMAHQTPLARVVPAWEEWMRRWPTPADAGAASRADVLRVWGNLGYPRRALRLAEAGATLAADPVLGPLACLPVDQAFSAAPADIYERLLALPGVGPYTAGAVTAFGCGRRALVLDTNVRRVLARVAGGTDQPAGAVTATERARTEALWPTDDAAAAAWTLHVMEFGALVCTARAPACATCPIDTACRWLGRGRPTRQSPLSRQRYTGTDRQARGRILAALRARPAPLTQAEALAAATLPQAEGDAQARRALAGLEADGLVESRGDLVWLPGDR